MDEVEALPGSEADIAGLSVSLQGVTKIFDNGVAALGPLDLKVRRPDLWTLELSCANTNTVVPALDIVDQVLENYIALQIQPGISVATVTPSAPPPAGTSCSGAPA